MDPSHPKDPADAGYQTPASTEPKTPPVCSTAADLGHLADRIGLLLARQWLRRHGYPVPPSPRPPAKRPS